MREDRDRVDFLHATLSMITGTSLRGRSHLDAAELQASYERSALLLQARMYQRPPENFDATLQHANWAQLKSSTLTWVF